jgi:hypothetical protein
MGTECCAFLLYVLHEACQLSVPAAALYISVCIATLSVSAVTKAPASGLPGNKLYRAGKIFLGVFVKNRDICPGGNCDAVLTRINDIERKQAVRKNVSLSKMLTVAKQARMTCCKGRFS